MAVMFGLGCVCVLVGAGVALAVSGVLLRAAVAAANRLIGAPKPQDPFGQWDDWDTDEPAPIPRAAPARAVPEPGFLTGALVTFVLGATAAVGYLCLVFVAAELLRVNVDEPAGVVLIFLAGLPFTGFGLSFLLTVTLPTTFKRAALVAFLYHLIAIPVTCVVGAIMLAFAFLIG
ncbi:hypothetical protein GobsT_70740 [Gemmata obscuriglobus]|uniref:Uncharacterized protein n=1 Tax=Gemmata obscuriglobus TaxID=114 RepID=A0A2Z3HJ12_9BACT|nr:hypothetical protein [Gemmata obscuriglobus]AWM41814.1 hypothetical protein C1280_35690 [Gemmata obscuriglobus]QEG32222.1 hypothetical protein GobsT_70740 [Gemmata obscuriglobus]VTS11575.1 unnamed protein product [Gemmata obscuriglobus UQM 2246]